MSLADQPRRSTRPLTRSQVVLREELRNYAEALDDIIQPVNEKRSSEELISHASEVKEVFIKYSSVARELKNSLQKQRASAEILALSQVTRDCRTDATAFIDRTNEILLQRGDEQLDAIDTSDTISIRSEDDLISETGSIAPSVPRYSPPHVPSPYAHTPPVTPPLHGNTTPEGIIAEVMTQPTHPLHQSVQSGFENLSLQQAAHLYMAPQLLHMPQAHVHTPPPGFLPQPSLLMPTAPPLPPPPPPPPSFPSQPSSAPMLVPPPPTTAPPQGAPPSCAGGGGGAPPQHEAFRTCFYPIHPPAPTETTLHNGNYSTFNKTYHNQTQNVNSSHIYNSKPNNCTISSQPMYNDIFFPNTVFTSTTTYVPTTLPAYVTSDQKTVSNPSIINSQPIFSNINSNPTKSSINPLSRVLDFSPVTVTDFATQHLIKQGLYAKDIAPFDGSAHLFAGWLYKLQSKLAGFKLTPSEVLCIMVAHSVGEPKKFLTEISAGTGAIDQPTLDSIFEEFRLKYGTEKQVSKELFLEIKKMPQLKTNQIGTFEKLSCMCQRIEFNMHTCSDLSIFNTAVGLEKLVTKLPVDSVKRWTKIVVDYRDNNRDSHPPFAVFKDFIKKECTYISELPQSCIREHDASVKHSKCFKTEIEDETSEKENYCFIHDTVTHNTNECSTFIRLPHADKERVVDEKNGCTRCLRCEHTKYECSGEVRCKTCKGKHATAMHNPKWIKKKHLGSKADSSEDEKSGHD